MARGKRMPLRLVHGDRSTSRQGDDDELVQLATRVPKRLHRAVRVHCIQTETSLMRVVADAIAAKLRREAGSV